MDPVKVARVVKRPSLKSKKEVQQFVGFVNFYCRFILDFSHITQPLYDITSNAPLGRRTTASIQRTPMLSYIGTGVDTADQLQPIPN
jgi:hypothetical protein